MHGGEVASAGSAEKNRRIDVEDCIMIICRLAMRRAPS